MKKMVMFTLICAVLLSLAADVRAKGKPGESRMFSEGVSYADRESHVEPWLEFYAGLGYYQWKMQYNTGLYGNSVFESTTQPFVLKQFDIRANLRILQFGLNYLTNRFNDAFNTTGEADATEETDPLARQLALFAGLGFGPMVLTTDAKFRKFEGTIRSNGMPVLTGVVPGRLYTDSGIVELPAGKEITWYSTIKDYSARIGTRRERKPGWNAALEFGGRLVEYKTPTEIGVKTHGIYPTKETNALFISDIRQYFAGFSFWFNYTGSSGLYWDWFVPAYLGANKTKNSYLEMGPGNTYTFSSVGNTAIGFRGDNVRLEAGLEYDYFISTSSYTTTLKRDLIYYKALGMEDKISAGSQVDLKMIRMELFWGIYVRATLML